MRSTHGLLLFLVLAGTTCMAAPDPANDASIEEYLKVSNARQLLDNMQSQVGGLIKNSMQQVTQGKSLTPPRQAILDHMASCPW